MPVTADKPAPYAPGATVLEVIDRRRSRGLPTPITTEVLGRAGIAPTLLPRVIQSLQGLDLIGADGEPTPAFEALRLAPEAEYQTKLREWLKGTYADIFAFVDPAKDDETRIRDAFRSYSPIGQQSRMVSLFQALCAAAGIVPDKLASKPAPPPRPRLRVLPLPPHRRAAIASAGAKSPPPASAHELHPALNGLLASLPRDGGWTRADREKFVKTFSAVLDFCIPIDDALEAVKAQVNEDGDP